MILAKQQAAVASIVLIGAALLRCGSETGPESSPADIEVTGIVLESAAGQTSGIELVGELPPASSGKPVPGTTVILASAGAAPQTAHTAEDGRFTLKVPSLSGSESDYLSVQAPGGGGFSLGVLRAGSGPLPLQPGKNVVVVRIPAPPARPAQPSSPPN